MREQCHLFDQTPPSWTTMVWDQCDPQVRQECLALLAEMGRTFLAAKTRPRESPVESKSERKRENWRREATDEH